MVNEYLDIIGLGIFKALNDKRYPILVNGKISESAIPTSITNSITSILSLIPDAASSENKLADKNFVNSSIATNTATFRGTFDDLATLQATSADINDYAFYVHTDEIGNTAYDRYKHNGSTWVFEYTLNNSSFTAEQWSAINSGITTTKVGNYDAHLINYSNPHKVTKSQVGLGLVENVAISTWKGSENITTLGTITKGTWKGTKIGNDYLANSSITIGTTAISLGSTAKSLAGIEKLQLNDANSNLVYDSTTGSWKLTGNLLVTGFISAGAKGTSGGGSSTYTQKEWAQIKGMTESASGILASAYAVKEAYNELNTAIETLAGKATNVTFAQTLTSGKQIGSISIDGKSTSLFAPANYAWSEVTGKPSFATVATSGSYSDLANKPTIASLMGSTAIGGTSSYLYWNGSAFVSKALGSNAFTSISKVSQLTNDSGYITGITKAMVEGVLTGNITSHTHNYLPLSGGTLTGSVTMQGMDTNLIRNITYTSTSSWARSLMNLQVDGISKFSISAMGDYTLGASDNGIIYAYIGCNSYDGLNLRISATSLSWGNNSILHAGNYNSYCPKLDGTGATGTWGISISGNAATATNADTLDGVHFQNILERETSGFARGTDVGWYRIAETYQNNSNSYSFLLGIQRSYANTNNETYLFSICISYRGRISITQLSGSANVRLIDKIRIDWARNAYYIDLYINTATDGNTYRWYTVGAAKSYTAWTANPTLNGTAYEFTTVNGCKSDLGFTGNIAGNSTSSSKWATARTITLTGSVTGSVSIDGSQNVSLATTTNHTHSYLPLAGGTMSNTNVVTNLNADLLDGYDASDFSRHITGTTQTTGTKYYKLGNLPESSGSTCDAFLIQGEIGNWGSTRKTVLNVCVSRRNGVTFCGYTQGLWNRNLGIDIGVNDAGEIVLIVTEQYCAWTLDLHTIQGTISYTGKTFTPTDTNFVLLSASNNVSKSLADGTVEKATKLATPRTITLTGSVTGSVSIDGSQNVSLATTTNHTHNYLPLSGGTLSGHLIMASPARIKMNGGIFEFNDSSGSTQKMLWAGMDPSTLSIWSDSNWYSILHSGNYNSYAPKLDGTGATGTWGISISGNAASASTVYTTKIAATSSSDVYYKISGILNTSITTTIFRITTRNSESYLLYVNKDDNKIVTPRITRERNMYSKIISFAWRGQDLYIKVNGYSNGSYITQINGTAISYSVTTTDESTYNSATSITIDESAFLTSNVASATKLATSRTIWGQSFNGTGNVSGSLTGTNFLLADRESNPYLRFTEKGLKGFVQFLEGKIAIGPTYTKSLVVDNNGNVGIGTSSPSYKLHIVGTAYASEGLVSDGYISSAATSTSSDIRLKDNISEISSEMALKWLSMLKPKSWTWNSLAGIKGRSMGFVAQDVEGILPQMIRKRRDNGYLSLDYTQLHALEVSALQSHEKRIEELERENKILKEELNKLKLNAN